MAPSPSTEAPRYRAYLSMGSNVGDPAQNLKHAIGALRLFGKVAAISSFYETEPVEYTTQPWFLNCVVALDTRLGPAELIFRVLKLEQQMGRERILKKGPRLIDVDIVLYDEAVLASQGLTIPHPAMHQRRFVLQPLSEIAPDVVHPLLQRSVRE
ncbi:MAG: 2-amino-4-hydroxy-6-hydroxymethyldihydropteridine diphosphokinase, partial [Acidobacteriales bacterium]|nr:2-amino-4-hydroxy-6-hydroxymethyldihydropteridine diphosphokinase [Terriglobales bacterium]